MENRNEESALTQPIQLSGSLSHEPQPPSSSQLTQKRNRLESPPHESLAPPQSPKRSKNANPSPPSFPPILPQEMIAEILSYLPVKSLLRFRCVSRSWKSLITHPFFVKKHLKKIQNDPRYTKTGVLISTGNTRTRNLFRIKSCSLNAIYQNPIVNSTEIEYLSKIAPRSNWIVGSCDGLICIAVQDIVYLLNPTLRVSIRLPDSGLMRRGITYTVYGFGFDASMDDYKVVSVFCYQTKGFEGDLDSIVSVYSLKTNFWRRIQGFPFGVPSYEAGKYVDGSLVWAVCHRREMAVSWKIVSLDLDQETYKEVFQPSYGDGAGNITLGVLDGCLSVLCSYGRLHADVWVMREFGKRESWTKLVTVPYVPDHRSELCSKPLFVSGSGEILFHFGRMLILYNPKEKIFRIPVIHGDAISDIDQAQIYVESLVSPTVNN
ncbi:hypothetical protein DITRI_Ditri15bG0068900 [Diplodiscus trichospermus]